MSRACPHCKTGTLRNCGRMMPHPVPVLVQIFGLFFALTYGESRKRIFACSECGEKHVTHTAISALFLVCYGLQLLLLAGCALLIAWLIGSLILGG